MIDPPVLLSQPKYNAPDVFARLTPWSPVVPEVATNKVPVAVLVSVPLNVRFPLNVGVPASVPESVAPAMVGVVSDGDVPNTSEPVPVSSVIAASRFALDGVARKVATPVPKPDMPVLTGSPVQLVRVPEVGVPRSGVTRAGEVARTPLPVPVVVIASRAVAPELMAMILLPLPVSAGILSKAASMAAISARALELAPAAPVAGHPVLLKKSFAMIDLL